MRSKKLLCILTGILLTTSLTVGASQIAQKIEVYYNDIQIKVDGIEKNVKLEPFNYDGSVYVGLRDMGELLGAQVDWDEVTQSVLIDTATWNGEVEEVATLQQQVIELKEQLGQAQEQLDLYEQQIDQYETSQIDVVELEKLLTETFKDEYDIEWYFDVKGDEKGVLLYIGFDSERENRDFDEMSQGQQKRFVQEVVELLQYELRNNYYTQNTTVEGKLYDIEADEVYVEFELDEDQNFYYDWVRKTIIDEGELEEYVGIMKKNYSEFPHLIITGYDTTAIAVKDITLVEKDGELVFNIYTSVDDFGRPYWNTLNLSNADPLIEYLEQIRVDVKGKFNMDVKGYVYDTFGDKMAYYNGHLILD